MSEDVDVEIPAYCELSEARLQERKPEVIAMMERLQAAEPIENGYRFTFPGDPETFELVTTFARDERICCAVADFELVFSGPGEAVHLAMQGPEGMQTDIREGLQLERFLEEAN